MKSNPKKKNNNNNMSTDIRSVPGVIMLEITISNNDLLSALSAVHV